MDFIEDVDLGECVVRTVNVVVAPTGAGVGAGVGAQDGAVEMIGCRWGGRSGRGSEDGCRLSNSGGGTWERDAKV